MSTARAAEAASKPAPALLGLIGDIGGTNARFALGHIEDGRVWVSSLRILQAADYPTGEDAVRAYLDGLDGHERPRVAVIAAAGPIEHGAVEFTNNTAWRFSEAGLVKAAHLDGARLINDFTAQSLALDHLRAEDWRTVGPVEAAADPDATAAILGPGTGFGCGARIRDGKACATLSGEAGHAAFAPTDELEVEVARRLAQRFGRVSIERILSGPGLATLYETLNAIEGIDTPPLAPNEITHRAIEGDELCRAALSRFCAVLGSVAGDLALAFGARAGVYVTGGIAPVILEFLRASDFRARFEDKGRLSDYVSAIPTRVVVRPDAALVGAASLLGDFEDAAR
ncbi:glucokinase [Phenylobacterium montanum]|uniref:glucokinase n=1 Tax=Phenylobacterium montanum TaxID=2823693 RepID=UPI002013BC18|nr:glucokinase [Caulobacter sp. S6]